MVIFNYSNFLKLSLVSMCKHCVRCPYLCQCFIDQKRNLIWFARISLSEPDIKTVIVDILGLCCAHHRRNETIQSNIDEMLLMGFWCLVGGRIMWNWLCFMIGSIFMKVWTIYHEHRAYIYVGVFCNLILTLEFFNFIFNLN